MRLGVSRRRNPFRPFRDPGVFRALTRRQRYWIVPVSLQRPGALLPRAWDLALPEGTSLQEAARRETDESRTTPALRAEEV